MQQITVGTKYQIVIPKEVRKKIKWIKPGAKVLVKPLGEQILATKTPNGNWVERTKGMMTKAWRGIDTTTELQKMRDEWEERFKGIEKNIK